MTRIPSRVARFALIAMLTIVASTRSTGSVVYSNNFETDTAGFNVSSRASLPIDATATPISSQFLGRLGNGSATLSLSGLSAGVTYLLAFDLFIGATWDGSGSDFGPDVFSVVINGVGKVNASFSNHLSGENPSSERQSYSDSNPNGPGDFAAFTGADVARTDVSLIQRYSIYYFGRGAGNPILNFVAGSSTASIVFSGSGLQSLEDEYWAIDNVVVESFAVVPEPSTVVAAIVGLVGLVAARRGKGRGVASR